jgi:hypothetical protein
MLLKIVIGVLIGTALYVAATAWLGFQEKPAPQTHQGEQKTESDENKDTTLRSAINRGLARQGDFIYDFREEIVAVGTLFIAAFTVILAFATGFLYFATRDLVEGADKNAEKQLRAYVFVKDGAVIITPDGGGFVAHIIFKNFGQTPAKDFSTWLGGGVFDANATPFPKEPKPLSERVNRSIVGPTAETPILTDSAALGDLTAIRKKTKAIFIWGGLDYVDAFGEPRHFIIRTKMTGPERDLGNGARGWPLTPDVLGYEAN